MGGIFKYLDGANFQEKVKNFSNMLHETRDENKLKRTQIIKMLLEDERVDVNTINHHGLTPLYSAGESNLMDVFKLLMGDSRIDLDAKDSDGNTILHIVCKSGSYHIVKLLIEHNPDIDLNMKNGAGETPFFLACGLIGIFPLPLINYLLSNKEIDIDAETNLGLTAFNQACYHGSTGIVSRLLKCDRIDPNRRSSNQWTPIELACLGGRLDIVKLLLADERVDYSVVNHSGNTPFFYACQAKHVEVVEYMLKNCDDLMIPQEKFDEQIEKILENYR